MQNLSYFMSDLFWVAFILIVYLVVIKPMMQGMLNKPANGQPKQPKTPGTPQQKKQGKDSDYVDYEEVK